MQQANESRNYTKIELSGGYFGGAASFAVEKRFYEHLQLAMAVKAYVKNHQTQEGANKWITWKL